MDRREGPDRALAADPAVRRAVHERRLRRTELVLRRLRRERPGGVAARSLEADAARLAREIEGPAPPPDPSTPENARAALDERPSVLDEPPAPAPDEATRTQGLRFDFGRNAWVAATVARDRSWWFYLRLCQLLDWRIEGVCDAPAELALRLAAAATDAATGAPLVARERVDELVEALGLAAFAVDAPPDVAALLDLAIDLQFSSTDGGDRPLAVTWQLSPRLLGTLLAVLDDAPRRERLFAAAAGARGERERQVEERRRALFEVLARRPGRPAWHKRAHWALVNLAAIGQSVAEMTRPGGLLPAGRARLSRELLAARFAGAAAAKVRFVLNDRHEIHVLDDGEYRRILAEHGFPPNHELLSAVRPIAAAGYLTLERGRVVGIEDDGLMIPGKLPPGLPPMVEVLRALGLPLDEDRVALSTLVVDWAGLAARAAERAGEVAAARDRRDGAAFRAALAGVPYGERPAAVVAHLRGILDEVASAWPALPRSSLWRLGAARAAESLRGFRLINVSGRDMASGDLPPGAEAIDEALAPYLLRKVDR